MRGEWVGQWAGKTVVCIASGPSLTAEDAATVKESLHVAVVANTTFRMCPWADVLISHDPKWARVYGPEVRDTFKGKWIKCWPEKVGEESLRLLAHFRAFGNSGSAAISLAVLGKADRVILLGYDCKPSGDGRKHWHADHPEPLTNAPSIDRWHAKFAKVAAYAKQQRVTVLNASRDTALDCFERGELAELLHP